MAIFTIKTLGGESKIFIGSGIKDFINHVPDRTVVITDKNVNNIYGSLWQDYQSIVIEAGEKNKTLSTVDDIIKQLLSFGVDRSGFILGVGGGIVCDIAGFVASTYMRGVRFAFVPTTLLAQVDASIGGKNGVNIEGFKNIIGTFNQPEFILIDPEVLKSLPPEEVSNGFAEAIKHALINDAEYFGFIEKNIDQLKSLSCQVLNGLIVKSVEIKLAIVNRDEREMGERRKLNFGHTFGHAIEKITGICHGKAVSLGSVIAARFSMKRGYINEKEFNRIRNVYEKLGLPVEYNFDKNAVLDALLNDKKREREYIHFILLNSIGSAIIEKISVGELNQFQL